MLTQELINTELGYILSQMGCPVTNAALYQQELGANCPTEDAILAKKAELDAAKAKAQAILDTGYTDPITGYVLGVAKSDQDWFGNGAAGLALLNLPDTAAFPIKEINGTKHQITVGQFKQIMTGYFAFCINLF